MGTSPLEASILKLLEQSRLPSDDGNAQKDYVWFARLSSRAFDDEHSELRQIFEEFCKQTIGTRIRSSDIEAHRRHWMLVLLNLSRASLLHRWVLISQKQQYYSSSYYAKRMNLSYSHMKAIFEFLKCSSLIEYRVGKKYSKQSLMTRIFPSQNLRKKLICFALEIEEAIEGPYIEVREPRDPYSDGVAWDHPEMKDMLSINEFNKAHQWACKGPVKIIYKGDPFGSGRLYTPFQCLPSRRVAIRQHTLIDDQSISEVDFNANHLRINLAVMHGADAGESPYEDIAELAGEVGRSKVKDFVTRAMGSSSREQAFNACKQEGYSMPLFERIESACYKRYPGLKLFIGFGISAQNLEGLVLRDALKIGVREGKVMLPIHDAVAVQSKDSGWAEGVLESVWVENINRKAGKAKPRLKVENNALESP